jgi:hypothetical protein
VLNRLHLAPYPPHAFTRKDSARPARLRSQCHPAQPANSFLNGHIDLDPGAASSDLAVMDVRNQVATDGETIVRAPGSPNGNVREIAFLRTRSRAVFMQWLNPG